MARDPSQGPWRRVISEEQARAEAAARRAAKVAAVTGTASPVLGKLIVDQVVCSLHDSAGQDLSERVTEATAMTTALDGILNGNLPENLLAAQMMAAHNLAMDCVARSQFPEQTFQGRVESLKHAAKLMALFARQVEVLDKHRGRGEQKITVEHVTVNAGGQAIVGSFDRPAGQPALQAMQEPQALSHDPGTVVPMMDQAEGAPIAPEPMRVRRTGDE